MAWFTYKCHSHGLFRVSLGKRQKSIPCKKCGELSQIILKVGTTVVHEKIDNGAMGRAVERIHNVEELIEERSNINTNGETNEEE
ncbi:hypothetical protein EBU95_03755 [bacterium]|nr:hypothetical protein [bacterium]